MTKTKIIIAGIGGVGGYFGGLLAHHFYNNESVEIDFLARGQHLEVIKNQGLSIVKGEQITIAKPHIATDNPASLGIADLLIISTKSYDLASVLEQLRPCINQSTVLLPLLNGVDSRQKIKAVYPDNLVLDGCVYIVSRLKQAGLVENSGNVQLLYFGLDSFVNEQLIHFEKLFKSANIEATLSQNIASIIWEKFIFISPTAIATSYYNKSIGEILANEESLATLIALITEIKCVAKAKNINISEDIQEKVLSKLRSLPFDSTSSMHSDFKNKKPHTEVDSLLTYVINEGRNHGVATPSYIKMAKELVQ